MGNEAELKSCNSSSTLSVSVVIPVRDDSRRLDVCLAALCAQTYPRDRYEIVVVDNASAQSPADVAAAHGPVRLLSEAQPTSSAARNAAIRSSQAEIFAFTDADCVPTLDWIANGVAALGSIPNCGLVAGHIDLSVRQPARPTAVELFELATAFDQRRYVQQWRFAATANAFTYRSVFDHVGLFDATLSSGADLEWGQRIFGAGYTQIYAATARVTHPARATLSELSAKHRRVIGGLTRLRETHNHRHLVATLLRDWPTPRDGVVLCTTPTLRGASQRLRALAVMGYIKLVRIRARVQAHRQHA
jgi:GT2 family glycosyltransferase